jgi:hypothetical protein
MQSEERFRRYCSLVGGSRLVGKGALSCCCQYARLCPNIDILTVGITRIVLYLGLGRNWGLKVAARNDRRRGRKVGIEAERGMIKQTSCYSRLQYCLKRSS